MNTESFVMDGEGPLPFDWRYYIGILVRFLSFFSTNVLQNLPIDLEISLAHYFRFLFTKNKICICF